MNDSLRVDYSVLVTPSWYQCSSCGASARKLWRKGNDLELELFCAECAAADQGIQIEEMTIEGKVRWDLGMTDQIGNLMPAVPTTDVDEYWGYPSVPPSAKSWWQSLPSNDIQYRIVSARNVLIKYLEQSPGIIAELEGMLRDVLQLGIAPHRRLVARTFHIVTEHDLDIIMSAVEKMLECREVIINKAKQ